MKKHIKAIHEGQKDPKCECCGKYFSQLGDLKKHIHAHHEGNKDSVWKQPFYQARMQIWTSDVDHINNMYMPLPNESVNKCNMHAILIVFASYSSKYYERTWWDSSYFCRDGWMHYGLWCWLLIMCNQVIPLISVHNLEI